MEEVVQGEEEISKLLKDSSEIPFEGPIYEIESNNKTVTERDEILNQPKLYSENIISIMNPVIIAMMVVIWAVQKLSPVLESNIFYDMFVSNPSNDNIWIGIIIAIVNSFFFVIAIVIVTIILVILYKYKYMKIIYGWLMMSTSFLFCLLGGILLDFFLKAYEIKLDYFSFFLFIYNFTIVGLLSIFWRAPKLFNQIYLICVSVITGWWITRLPEWTTWLLLITVALYDIFAVLFPKGPLKILVETAQERSEPIPGLIYEGASFKLGLGDFVFYSVLVGRSSMYDFTTCIACFISILTGLCLTLFILGFTRKALPALPFSIFLATIFYIITRFFILPYLSIFSFYNVLI